MEYQLKVYDDDDVCVETSTGYESQGDAEGGSADDHGFWRDRPGGGLYGPVPPSRHLCLNPPPHRKELNVTVSADDTEHEAWMDPETFLPDDHGGAYNPDTDRWGGLIRLTLTTY